jgi:hypothetical protein
MIKKICIFAVVILAFGIVCHFDYEDEEEAEALYCDNVTDKVWPDFKGTYKKYCKNFSSERLTQTK